jgi:ABC-type phosphate/phosphonate transport system substrate-binding protein
LNGSEESNNETRIPIVMAFEVSEGMLESETSPEMLADILTQNSRFDFTIYAVDSEAAMLEALRFGNADIALMDSGAAWIGWNQYGLEAFAADQKSDGRTYYNSLAWVLNDSDIAQAYFDDDPLTNPFSLMQGKTSCHTGWLHSTGMMVPMGFFLGLGYANVIGDPNDLESLRDTIFGFFNENSSIPEPGTQYYGFSGALKCLSDGRGEIAFAKDNTVSQYCTTENGNNVEEWCLDTSRYIALEPFAKTPSDVFMTHPEFHDDVVISELTDVLVNFSSNEDFSDMLYNTLGTKGVVSTDSDSHLSVYTPLVSNIPGISAYYTDNENTSITITIEELIIAFELGESETNNDPIHLAEYLTIELGINVSIHYVNSQSEMINSLETGEAHIGFLPSSSSLIAWKLYNLSVLGAIQNKDQLTQQSSIALVSNSGDLAIASIDDDSSTNPFAMMQGKASCFTGFQSPIHTILPIHYLIENEYYSPNEENTDIVETIHGYFSNDSSVLSSPNPSLGEAGAIRCLSENVSEIAFVGEYTLEENCGQEGQENQEWCEEIDQYFSLGQVGVIPSNSIMYNPSTIDSRSRAAILNALVALNYQMYLENYSRPGFGTYTGCYDIFTHKVNLENPREICGDEILNNILHGTGIVRTNSQDHLGSFSDVIRGVPGAYSFLQESIQSG